MSTTHVPFVDALNAVDQVLACAWAEKLRSPSFQEALSSGRMVALLPNAEARREQIVALAPALVLDHPFGQVGPPVGIAGTWVPVCEYLEEHPLARAEWIRFFGVLFGCEAMADRLFRGIEERYERALLLAGSEKARPKVFFGSAWEGTWSVPPGNSYMARLINDAGGTYLYAAHHAPNNLELHLETVLADAHRADHWGMIVDVADLRGVHDLPGVDARLSAAPALGKGLFVANSDEADLFGQALLEPDKALADLIAIFHPDLLPDHPAVYYRPLAQ